MGVGGQRGLPHPRQQRLARRVPREVEAQRQAVDEEADQALGREVVTVGDRRPHHEVVLAARTGEQRGEAREQGHEQGRPVPPAGPGEPLGGLRVQGEAGLGAAVALRRRARPVGRQVERRRRSGQFLPPVRELALHLLVAEPPPLPDGEVGVLDRQLGQRARAAGERRLIERADLLDQHPQRPPVGDDVMEVEQQRVVVVQRTGAVEEGAAQQRTAPEVERPPRLLAGDPQGLGGAPLGGQRREVEPRQAERRGRRDQLRRLAADLREAGAQRLVTPHHLREHGIDPGGRQPAADGEGQRHVVDR